MREQHQGGCLSDLVTHVVEIWYTTTAAYGIVKHAKCLTCGLEKEEQE